MAFRRGDFVRCYRMAGRRQHFGGGYRLGSDQWIKDHLSGGEQCRRSEQCLGRDRRRHHGLQYSGGSRFRHLGGWAGLCRDDLVHRRRSRGRLRQRRGRWGRRLWWGRRRRQHGGKLRRRLALWLLAPAHGFGIQRCDARRQPEWGGWRGDSTGGERHARFGRGDFRQRGCAGGSQRGGFGRFPLGDYQCTERWGRLFGHRGELCELGRGWRRRGPDSGVLPGRQWLHELRRRQCRRRPGVPGWQPRLGDVHRSVGAEHPSVGLRRFRGL